MFNITCPCGKTIPVRAGQAGGTLPCGCGQTVPIPTLGELRRSAAEAGRATSPRLIQHDWRAWWRGVLILVAGCACQLVAFLLPSVITPTTGVIMAVAVLLLAGYVLSFIGTLGIGLGKGLSLGVCLLLVFVIPFGGLVVLFFPGKGADATP
ncbi:hypothetical protein [Limnoglobus roseus]|uniref:Uncharacterized protein n=1 Tax=Limnoglobus roseus TaxID=2598579 RepID=A0A5C1ATS8_9BACT|nr:hypothetical protein [Limnoglobus roseus]QEL20624.1 hypothetical protein PX52LOC_07729 [Limnoglobus roseus]